MGRPLRRRLHQPGQPVQVANITRGQVKKLEASGIETMAALARHDGPVRGVASATAEKLVGQARLQHARKTGEPAFELRPAQPGKGFDLRSEEHTSELQSLMRISYAVFCLKKKTTRKPYTVNKK